MAEEFKLLFLTHRWTPIDISGNRMALLYDNVIRVSFDLNEEAYFAKVSINEEIPEFLVCFLKGFRIIAIYSRFW
jgi:hypothetical protein